MTSQSKNLHRFWYGKRVLLTGHTGFKGGWAGAWLKHMGAEVHGFSLAPETEPGLYGLLNIPYASEYIADLRDRDAVANAVKAIDPQLVLHMAAQPLVRRGYREPVETMATNVMGTAHLLDALRASENLLGALIVTSDKAYDNDSYDQAHGDVIFREGDALGGRDPYSASKGAQEIVTRSFGQSFFREKNIPVVTARAGNVIGGGDWSEDRLMTDIITAIATNQPVILRSPDATRPWQHVLEPVAGYLMFLQAAVERRVEETTLNFGPDSSNTVAEVVDLMLAHWGSNSGRVTEDKGDGKKEARTLALDSSLAKSALGWQPRLDLASCIEWIVQWHKAQLAGQTMTKITAAQVASYEDLMDRK
ncbi:CDP-glucose 4,6-dehydratase [Thalassospira lucentensis]|uniref:CDP-glucose 4,6-dehydratase n=1 Tax=Thalassospira lucentensis TaxID=168935 RepID=A0A154L390_9PROT|nr:CDP-glucose 4,6-dehydratase [Thalassospira lucentensis]KZB62918.1 CDP-glucose 4,6-dehydratase [Thalassospira lucentensis]